MSGTPIGGCSEWRQVAILVDLHNTTCPNCQRADGVAHNGNMTSKSIQSGQATPVPILLPNSQQGDSVPHISPIPSLISNSSSGSALPFFFAGARERFQEALGYSVLINKREVSGNWTCCIYVFL